MGQSIKAAALALVALLAAAPSAAFATDDSGVTIKTGDLDLASPAGKAALDRRTRSAASQLCSGEQTTGSRIGTSRARQQCIDAVREQIRQQLTRRAG